MSIRDPNSERLYLLSSDLEISNERQQEQEDSIQQVLDQIGAFLDQADESLEALDENDDDLVSSAILRSCGELADAVAAVADQLDQQSQEQKLALAQACRADIQEQLRQENQHQVYHYALDNDGAIEGRGPPSELIQLSEMDENEFMHAIEAAQNFLHDVEASLRSIDQDTAEELADVGLAVARLFVASLQSVHAQISASDILEQTKQQNRSPEMEIEFIQDADDENAEAEYSREATKAINVDNDSTGKTEKKAKRRKHKGRSDRIRVLWPPIGPEVSKCLAWVREEATKRPILSAALGIVFWPAAVTTALVGTPMVIADGFLQDFYNHFEDAPLVEGLERGAAHLYQTARLALLSGKLVSRQTVFVVKRQVERHGGVGQIAQNCADLAIDRVTHPIETVQMACGGIAWGWGQIQRAVQEFQDQERQEAVQALQI